MTTPKVAPPHVDADRYSQLIEDSMQLAEVVRHI